MNIHRIVLSLALAAAAGGTALAGVAPTAGPQASAAPAAAATNAPPAEDPAVTAEAKAQYAAWETGKIDRSKYSADASKQLTDAMVTDVSGKLAPFGDPKSFTFLDKSVLNGNAVYTYGVETPKGKLQMLLALDGAGKISGIFFRPAP
jgi:hypothetical protein